jgi:hypothetical protein
LRETARADSLRRYLAFELPDEDDCTCEKCTAAREFKEQSGFDVRVNAAIVPGNDDGPTAMITDDAEKMREIEARALAVQPIPAWRCSACKAVIELKKSALAVVLISLLWCLWICLSIAWRHPPPYNRQKMNQLSK